MNEFFAMGGHGGYVWSAYGITLLVLVINGWAARRRFRRALLDASQYQNSEAPVRKPQVTTL